MRTRIRQHTLCEVVGAPSHTHALLRIIVPEISRTVQPFVLRVLSSSPSATSHDAASFNGPGSPLKGARTAYPALAPASLLSRLYLPQPFLLGLPAFELLTSDSILLGALLFLSLLL